MSGAPPAGGTRRRRRGRRQEHGSVSVHALWVSLVLCTALVLGLQVTALVQLRHRVTAAADLAALAGSRASSEGRRGCEAAREVAARNHVRLSDCRMDLDVATVAATASVEPWWGGTWTTTIESRAAPAWYER